MNPEPPKNVRLEHEDGETIGCEVYYLGRDEQGIHQWEVTADTSTLLQPGWRMAMDALPPRTSVGFKMTGLPPELLTHVLVSNPVDDHRPRRITGRIKQWFRTT